MGILGQNSDIYSMFFYDAHISKDWDLWQQTDKQIERHLDLILIYCYIKDGDYIDRSFCDEADDMKNSILANDISWVRTPYWSSS